MKKRIIHILKRPLELVGFKFFTEPTLKSIFISYAILFFPLSVILGIIGTSLPVPFIYLLYMLTFFVLIFTFVLLFGLCWCLKNCKSTSTRFGIIVIFLIVGIGPFIVIGDFIIYDNFGFKRETIETRLTRYNSRSFRDFTCRSRVRAEINNKIYDYGCSDPNIEILSPNFFDENSTYQLIILPNSQSIIKAEKVSDAMTEVD